jgi:hypothetical protein
MEKPSFVSPSALSPTEIEQLRPALAARYPHAKGVLGSQLGAFVRRHLANPDLKRRFGGLKEFISHYFPAEIVWRGRQGLDDLYDISFAVDGSGPGTPVWQPVLCESSADLWSAVTNPSVYVQFAWSAKEKLLLQAPAGVPLVDDLTAVEKLTKTDYQNIAIAFVDSLGGMDIDGRTQALDTSASGAEFTRLMRDKGLLAKWEEFRIDRARRQFVDRLSAAGVESSIVTRWADILRSSQQAARSRRLQKAVVFSVAHPLHTVASREHLRDDMPDTRAIAIKAMEFLSDAEISDLSLPLGTVMRALGSLIRRP